MEQRSAISLNMKKLKIGIIIIILFVPLGYLGIGYMVASASLSVNPGCGMWSENTPDNWDTDDDWESFEPWNDSAERIEIRKTLDVTDYQIDSYQNVTFSPTLGCASSAFPQFFCFFPGPESDFFFKARV